MTDDMMALRALLEKGSDASLLREMIGFAAQRLMELETEGLCGAGHGERSANRGRSATADRRTLPDRGRGQRPIRRATPERASGTRPSCPRRTAELARRAASPAVVEDCD